MAERGWRDFAFDAKYGAELADDVFDRAGADRVAGVTNAIATTESRGRAGAANLIAAQIPVRLQSLSRFGVKVNRPAFASLGPVDIGLAIDQLDIAPAERAQFGDAYPGPKEHQDHGSDLIGAELLGRILSRFGIAHIGDDPFEIAEFDIGRRWREAGHEGGNANSDPVGRERGVE